MDEPVLSKESLKRKILEAYPPTHTFDLETMRPGGVLRARVKQIEEEFPDFLEGGSRFLDIGCNKGFFLRRWREWFDESVGIEPDPDMVQVARAVVCGESMVVPVGFQQFTWPDAFDRVFIGNGPHHLFREIQGNEWVGKLAALTKPGGYALTEQPEDRGRIPGEEFDGFLETFQPEMRRWFEEVRRVPSVLRDRSVVLWCRKPWDASWLGPVLFKAFKDEPSFFIHNTIVDMGVAATSPISNGLVRFVEGGWEERFNKEAHCRFFEAEHFLFRQLCKHGIYLARVGYWDIDTGTINFWEDETLFDKSGVIPISRMLEYHVEVYFSMLRNSYRTLSETMLSGLREGFLTFDPAEIEEAYRWALSFVT